MSEPVIPTATVAQKRAWLREHGYTVGDRGKLSAAHEEAYNQGQVAQQPQG